MILYKIFSKNLSTIFFYWLIAKLILISAKQNAQIWEICLNEINVEMITVTTLKMIKKPFFFSLEKEQILNLPFLHAAT